jgi:hypothetical protein
MSFNGVENAMLGYAISEIEKQLVELGILCQGENAGLGNAYGIKYAIVAETKKLTAWRDGIPIEGLEPVNCYNFESRGDLASTVREFLRWQRDPAAYGCDFFIE